MLGAARLIQRKSLIVDTDVAFDDIVALMCLKRQSNLKLDLLTTVGGVNDVPTNAAKCLKRLFPTNSVVSGLSPPLDLDRSSPSWLTRQQSDLKLYQQKELGLYFGDSDPGNKNDGVASLDAITSILSKSKDGLVDLLCLGPLTDVASWVQNDIIASLISTKVHRIYIMGGNDPFLANKAEFNFEQDPQAALQVLQSSHTRDKVYLVPQETCLNTVDENLVENVKEFASHYKESLLARTLPWGEDSLVYDPVAAFCYTNSASCQIQNVNVKIDESSGIVSTADNSEMSTRIRVATNVCTKDYIEWVKQSIQVDSE
jgi:inosine-uridine nucleoside N-ribohydrolase